MSTKEEHHSEMIVIIGATVNMSVGNLIEKIMKITALCKTFRGHEFLEAMIRSIYLYVDYIVFVNSEYAWDHRIQGNVQKVGNTCKPVIERLIVEEGMNKIISLNYDTTDQFDQCMYGFEYIKAATQTDFVMLIDTDEVWDGWSLREAIRYLEKRADHDYVYRARLYTYIKSLYYRVNPPEVMAPTIFVSARRADLGENHRCCRMEPMCKMTDYVGDPIFFHHFVYVRKDLQTVLEKIRNSNGYEGNKIVNLCEWVDQVWNRIPEPFSGKWKSGFHPAIGFQGHWGGIKKVGKDLLPDIFTRRPELLEGVTDDN